MNPEKPSLDSLLEASWTCYLHKLEQPLTQMYQPQAHYRLIWLSEGSQGEAELDFIHLQLQAGQCLFVAPGQVLRLNLTHVTGWQLDFGLDTFCQSGLNDSQLDAFNLFGPMAGSPVLTIPTEQRAELEQIWHWWASENQADLPYQRQVSSTYLRLMLLRLARIKALAHVPVPQAEAKNELWPQFRQLLESHFKLWHQVAEYAQVLAVTPGHLNELVKQASGQSAKALIQERLMLEARRSAWFSSASLKEIAYELGFDDPAYFSRLFKRCSGEPFSEFRERIREMSNS